MKEKLISPESNKKDKRISRRNFLKGVTGAVAYSAIKSVVPGSLEAGLRKEKKQEKIDKFISEILPEIKPYYSGLDALLDNIYSLDSKREIPDFVNQRVKEIFSGDLSNIQDWNEELFQKGLRDHYVAYILQDFRNSKTAEKLAGFYKSLRIEERVIFEEKLRKNIPYLIYEIVLY